MIDLESSYFHIKNGEQIEMVKQLLESNKESSNDSCIRLCYINCDNIYSICLSYLHHRIYTMALAWASWGVSQIASFCGYILQNITARIGR